MLPKPIRNMRQEAKKHLSGIKRVIKIMDTSLASENVHKISVAAAFLQILNYHMNEGDLKADDLVLASLLRADNIQRDIDEHSNGSILSDL